MHLEKIDYLQKLSLLPVFFLAALCIYGSSKVYEIDITNFDIQPDQLVGLTIREKDSPLKRDINSLLSSIFLSVEVSRIDASIQRLYSELTPFRIGAELFPQISAEQDFGALTKIYQIQPTGYLALPLEVLRAEVSGVPPSSTFNTLRARLPLGLHEEETQRYVGPYIIHHWNVLPEDIQSMSLPMIQSGLRQAPTRQVLLDAMASSGNVAPFMSLSPNRKTSEVMKSLLQNVDIAE